MNLDAHVNELDYSAFAWLLAVPDVRADLNGNGVVKIEEGTWEDRSMWDGADTALFLLEYERATCFEHKGAGNVFIGDGDALQIEVADGDPVRGGIPVLSQPDHSSYKDTVLQNAGCVGINNRFGYGGYWFEPELGLYFVRNRVLDPKAGRWLTRDPIGYAGGWNLYEYVGGQPGMFVDPMGLAPNIFGDVFRGLGWDEMADGAEVLDDKVWGVDSEHDNQWERATLNAANNQFRQCVANAMARGATREEANCQCAGIRDSVLRDHITVGGIREHEWTIYGDAIEGVAVTVTMPILGGGGPWISGVLGGGSGVAMRVYTDRGANWDDLTASALRGVTIGGAHNILNSAGNAIATTIRPDRLVSATRWGGQAGQPGSWAMQGRPTIGNYLGSGKWQPGMGNQFAAPWNVTSAQVAASSMRYPGGVMGFFKGMLIGQRVIVP